MKTFSSHTHLKRFRESGKAKAIAAFSQSQRALLEGIRDGSLNPTVGHIVEALGSDFFAQITLDAMHKRLLAAYSRWSPAWTRMADPTNVSDFRLQRALSAFGFDDLDTVPELGEYPMDEMGDESRGTYKIAKRGAIMGLSMEAMANDELNVFGRRVNEFGVTAIRTLEKFCLGTNLDSNPAIYDGENLIDESAHSNNVTGALSAATLKTAITKLRNQTDENGNPIDVTAATLIVHPDEEWTAMELVQSARRIGGDDGSGGTAMENNVLQGRVTVIVSPYITTGQWYLLANPQVTAMFELGFFRGRQDPEMFAESPGAPFEFTHDAMRFKTRHIYGGTWREYRGVIGGGFTAA